MPQARHHDRQALLGSAEDDRQQFERALLAAQDRASWLALQCEQVGSERDAMLSRVRLLEGSIAFNLGVALLRARTFRGLLSLPRELAHLARRALRRAEAETDFQVGLELAPVPDPRDTPVPIRQAPRQLRELRVAAILDEFTHAGLAPDCDLHNLPAEDFESLLDDLQPHFLLVESAWRGSRGEWRDKLHPPSAHLRYLVDCCRRRRIPTVFWNKEDPVHFEHFIDAAALFDHVFTTDSACISRYRERLGHDRVAQLSFFCQPSLHDPIESIPREAAACFAGSWYRAYPERARDFERIVDAVERRMPVVIHDRNEGRDDPAFAFPERFAPLLKGRLEYHEIDRAYKGYRYGIALNTVKDSPTMVSRRIFELLASNTITISNQATGISRQLDGLVVMGDAAAIDAALGSFEGSVDARHRFRLRGLREVLLAHTAARRLRQITERVLDGACDVAEAKINVLARAGTRAQLHAILSAFNRQNWAGKHLLLVTELPLEVGDSGTQVDVMDPQRAGRTPIHEVAREGWVAMLHPEDYYGPDYLTDLALATLYAFDGPIGKGCWFQADDRGGVARQGGPPYTQGAPLFSRSSILPCRALDGASVLGAIAAMEAEDEAPWTGVAIDEFGYCRNASSEVASLVDVSR